MKIRTLAAGAAIIAASVAGAGLLGSDPASAHDGGVSAGCQSNAPVVNANLTNYNGTNAISIKIDGTEVSPLTFGNSYSKSFNGGNTPQLADAYTAHTVVYKVTAHDDPTNVQGFSPGATLNIPACKQKPTQPPAGEDVTATDCTTGDITVTITTTPYTYVWSGSEWVKTPGSPVVTSRPLTDKEQETCKPENPPSETVVDTTGTPECGDTTVETRTTVTNFTFEYVDGAWVKTPSGTAEVSFGTRDLTPAELNVLEQSCIEIIVEVECGSITVSEANDIGVQQAEISFPGSNVATVQGDLPLTKVIGEDVNGGGVNYVVRAGDFNDEGVIDTDCKPPVTVPSTTNPPTVPSTTQPPVTTTEPPTVPSTTTAPVAPSVSVDHIDDCGSWQVNGNNTSDAALTLTVTIDRPTFLPVSRVIPAGESSYVLGSLTPGTYTLTISFNGVTTTHTFTARDCGAVPITNPPTIPSGTTPAGELPSTGGNTTVPLVLGLLFIGIGVPALLMNSHKRRVAAFAAANPVEVDEG